MFKKYVIDNNLGTIETNYSFKELTTIGCGGIIDTLFTPNSIKSLQKAFLYINEFDLNYFILGNGSNVLACLDKYDLIVINLRKLDYSYNINKNNNNIINVSAFYPTTKLAYDLAKLKLGDLSFLGGIPGLLGGAIYNNSGAYSDDISKHLIDVSYINSNGEIITINNEECAFSYRRSIFHYIKGIIIEARFKIDNIDTFDILKKRLEKRKISQPLEAKSMGSIFKNNPLIPAWKVIDALGMRGFNLNNACISHKHSNFIINAGDTKGIDVYNLINIIKRRSELEFGIKLDYEITII